VFERRLLMLNRLAIRADATVLQVAGENRSSDRVRMKCIRFLLQAIVEDPNVAKSMVPNRVPSPPLSATLSDLLNITSPLQTFI
jgi:hypothetical protein